MNEDRVMDDLLPRITQDLVTSYAQFAKLSHLGQRPLPSREDVVAILNDLFELFYPGFYRRQNLHIGNVIYHVGDLVDSLYDRLGEQIGRALVYMQSTEENKSLDEIIAPQKAMAFLERLPHIRSVLQDDVEAALNGDPAAVNHAEIVFCYPGLRAVTVYRIAHELLSLGVPLIPRMMSEYAHSLTGIDIHPGAQIGHHFFVDHGTGVVIGETCTIGDHVTLYQGVTLGSLSFPRDASGQLIRGKKRHPTLENGVIVFANATVLGGHTVVGHHSIVGSNVWLTHSVEPYTVVTLEKPSLRFKGQASEYEVNYQI